MEFSSPTAQALQSGANVYVEKPFVETTEEAMRLLRRIAKDENRSVVIVSHDQRIKDIADRVLWLEDGDVKAVVVMAIDSVCGMSVDHKSAPAHTMYGGQVYYLYARLPGRAPGSAACTAPTTPGSVGWRSPHPRGPRRQQASLPPVRPPPGWC